MRFSHALAFALLISCFPSLSCAEGSLAARVHAATAAQQQAALKQAVTVPAPSFERAESTESSENSERGKAESLQVPPLTLTSPQTTRQQDSADISPPHRGPHAARSTQTRRINVADWLNKSPEASSTGSLELTAPRPAPILEQAAREPQTNSTISSRRQTTGRFTSPVESSEHEQPPAKATAEPDGTAILILPLDEGTSGGVASSTDQEVGTNTQDEPAILSADDVKASEPLNVDDSPQTRSTETEATDEDGATQLVQEPEDEDEEPASSAPRPVIRKNFSPQMLRLRDRIRSCLMYYYQRPENIAQRSPWGIMHSLIAFGVDTEILAGNQRVNAIGWLCYNRPCRGMQLLHLEDGYVTPRNGPGYQGHEGQLLSMLALSRVKSTYPMRVEGKLFTVEDLIEYEKWTCRPRTELTFKLIGLSHYLPSDATWESKWGEQWSIPRLIREELTQPINGSTCGGTHRLIGYSMAVKVRQKRGEPIDGQWLRAEKYVDAYHKYVIKLQNRDGSFSTSWLKQRDSSGEIDRRIQTTGHILEWLAFSLPEDELTDPRIVAAVNYLNNAMLSNRARQWEIGPRGHALCALALYNERVFGDKPGQRREMLARRIKR